MPFFDLLKNCLLGGLSWTWVAYTCLQKNTLNQNVLLRQPAHAGQLIPFISRPWSHKSVPYGHLKE